MKSRILFDFQRGGDDVVRNRLNSVLGGMKNNPYFPNPEPPLAELELLKQQFDAALSEARSRDNEKILVKNNVKETLRIKLKQEAHYVSMVANGDRLILLSSGFKVSAETTSTGLLGPIQGFTVEPGPNSGELVIRINKIENALTHILRYTQTPEDPASWKEKNNTARVITLGGLESIKACSMYLWVLGSGEQNARSEIIVKGVL